MYKISTKSIVRRGILGLVCGVVLAWTGAAILSTQAQQNVPHYIIAGIVTSGDGNLNPLTHGVDAGGSTTMAIIPGRGWTFEQLSDNGVLTTTPNLETYILEDVQENHEIRVSFKAGSTHAVHARVRKGAGTLFPDSTQTIQKWRDVSFTITPAEGYEFEKLIDNGLVTTTPGLESYTIEKVQTNHTVEVYFKKIAAGPINGGSIPEEEDFKDTPPSNISIKINGDNTSTDDTRVVLTLTGERATKVTLSNSPDISRRTWIDFVPKVEWELEPGEGEKRVYALFHDQYINVSESVSDTIELIAEIFPQDTEAEVVVQEETRIEETIEELLTKLIGIQSLQYKFEKNIHRGEANAGTTELQKRLMSEGVYTGTITGIFGPETTSAVRAYQTAHNIYPTGFVGPMTRGALDGRVLTQAELDTVPDLVDYLVAIGAQPVGTRKVEELQIQVPSGSAIIEGVKEPREVMIPGASEEKEEEAETQLTLEDVLGPEEEKPGFMKRVRDLPANVFTSLRNLFNRE